MGFKKTSGIITVSNRIESATGNTYTQRQLDLPLDTLNNEIFVVLAVDFALSPPDAVASTDTAVQCQLSTTSQAAITGLEHSNIVARGENAIRGAGYPSGGVGFSHMSSDTPMAELDYIAIVATPDCYLAVAGDNNASPKSVAMRMWGYRAKADAATYAALVQSEVLSA